MPPRCSICGRFIGKWSFYYEQVKVKFTPDTEHTIENIEYEHIYHEKEKQDVCRS